MHIYIFLQGLIGRGYHGGSMTCWAILRSALKRGHRVTVFSLLDMSSDPHLKWRNAQIQSLRDVGAAVELIEYTPQDLIDPDWPKTPRGRVMAKLSNLIRPRMGRYFRWTRLRPRVEEKLKRIKPDAIFCFHFDALCAVYKTKTAPIIFDAGDLWHLPLYFRWKAEPLSVKKYLRGWLYQKVFARASKRLMKEMVAPCARRACSAAHYGDWFRKQKGFADMLYFRTPVQDIVGSQWKEKRKQHQSDNTKAKALFVGSLGATATYWGLRFLTRQVLPVLEKEYDMDTVEIHHVGLGMLPPEFKTLAERPYMRMRGYVEDIDREFLNSDVVLELTPITLGIRARIITSFSYGSCIITHKANRCGIPEIAHEQNALVAKNGKDFAHQLIRALKDADLRERLREGARRTYEQYFSEDKAGEYVVKVIEGTQSIK